MNLEKNNYYIYHNGTARWSNGARCFYIQVRRARTVPVWIPVVHQVYCCGVQCSATSYYVMSSLTFTFNHHRLSLLWLPVFRAVHPGEYLRRFVVSCWARFDEPVPRACGVPISGWLHTHTHTHTYAPLPPVRPPSLYTREVFLVFLKKCFGQPPASTHGAERITFTFSESFALACTSTADRPPNTWRMEKMKAEKKKEYKN